jgi:hypothetical protein
VLSGVAILLKPKTFLSPFHEPKNKKLPCRSDLAPFDISLKAEFSRGEPLEIKIGEQRWQPQLQLTVR